MFRGRLCHQASGPQPGPVLILSRLPSQGTWLKSEQMTQRVCLPGGLAPLSLHPQPSRAGAPARKIGTKASNLSHTEL